MDPALCLPFSIKLMFAISEKKTKQPQMQLNSVDRNLTQFKSSNWEDTAKPKQKIYFPHLEAKKKLDKAAVTAESLKNLYYKLWQILCRKILPFT